MKKILILLLTLVPLSSFSIEINPKAEWNGVGTHPYKKLNYLKSDDFGKCEVIALTYSYLPHSPKVQAITSTVCIVTLEEGKGINKKRACTILDIDWDGNHRISYIKQGRVVIDGDCNKESISILKKTLESYAKEMGKMLKGTKLHYIRG